MQESFNAIFTDSNSISAPPAAHTTTPEKRLVAAVFEDAIKVLDGPIARLRLEAREWFESRSNATYSFLWCCDVLGIEPEAVGAVIRRSPTAPSDRTDG